MRKLFKTAILGFIGAFASLLLPSVSQAITINPGYDFLHTVQAEFDAQEYMALPFGNVNPGFGSLSLGNTDVILHRSVPVTPTLGGTTIQSPDFEILALSIVSKEPVSGRYIWIGGVPTGSVTMPSGSHDPTSLEDLGSSAATFYPDMFSSVLGFRFNMMEVVGTPGATLDTTILGPELNTFDIFLTQPLTPWSPNPPPNAVLPDLTGGFFLPFTVISCHLGPNESHCTVSSTTLSVVPEPASLLLLGSGLGLLAFRRRKAA